MKFANYSDLLCALCRAHRKWGIYISFDCDQEMAEVLKAAPYLAELDVGSRIDLFVCGFGYFLLDSEEECYKHYNQTVGDDGPTKTNSYNGPAKVYALTCSPNGILLSVNT